MIDVVVADENLHEAFLFDRAANEIQWPRRSGHWRKDMQKNASVGGARKHTKCRLTEIMPAGAALQMPSYGIGAGFPGAASNKPALPYIDIGRFVKTLAARKKA